MLKDETANTNVFVCWKGTYNTHGSHLYLLYGVYKQQNLDTEASAEFLEVVEYFILNMHTARALSSTSWLTLCPLIQLLWPKGSNVHVGSTNGRGQGSTGGSHQVKNRWEEGSSFLV